MDYDKSYIWEWIEPRLSNNRLINIEERFSLNIFKWDINERRRLFREKKNSQEIPIYSGIFNHYMTDIYNRLTSVISFVDINSDTAFVDVIPLGFMLEFVIIEEKTGNSPILSLGTTLGGTDVFNQNEIFSSKITTNVLHSIFSFTDDTTLYLSGDWDGSTIDVYFVLRKII